MTDFKKLAASSKSAGQSLSREMAALGADKEAELLAKIGAVFSMMEGAVSILAVASAGMQMWTGIQSARAVAETAKAVMIPPMWPVLAAATGAGIAVGAVAAAIMSSKTIRADLSTAEGKATALQGIREAMA